MEFKKATTYFFIFLWNCHFVISTNNTANHVRVARMVHPEVAPLGKYKFVAFVQDYWCEINSGPEDCNKFNWFTATILTDSYMITSSQNIPCVVRHKVVYTDNASKDYTFRNLRFDIHIGRTSGELNGNPTQRIEASYPDDIDLFFEAGDTELPSSSSNKDCHIEPDLVLLYVNISIKFNEYVQSIPILRMPMTPKTDKCIALNHNKLGELEYVDVNVGYRKYCKQIDKRFHVPKNKPYYVCAKTNSLRDICGVDTGGPLVCGSENTFYYLVGILWSEADGKNDNLQCGRSNTHYTRYIIPGYFENWLSITEAHFVNLHDVRRRTRARSSNSHRSFRSRSGDQSNRTEEIPVEAAAATADAMKTHPHSAAILIVFIVCCHSSYQYELVNSMDHST